MSAYILSKVGTALDAEIFGRLNAALAVEEERARQARTVPVKFTGKWPECCERPMWKHVRRRERFTFRCGYCLRMETLHQHVDLGAAE